MVMPNLMEGRYDWMAESPRGPTSRALGAAMIMAGGSDDD